MKKVINKALLDAYHAKRKEMESFNWEHVWDYLYDYLTRKERFPIKGFGNGQGQVVIKNVETSYVTLEVCHNQPDFPECVAMHVHNARVVNCQTSVSDDPESTYKYTILLNVMLFAEGEDPYERDEHAVD